MTTASFAMQLRDAISLENAQAEFGKFFDKAQEVMSVNGQRMIKKVGQNSSNMHKFWLIGKSYVNDKDISEKKVYIYTLAVVDWFLSYSRLKSSYDELQREALNEAVRNILV